MSSENSIVMGPRSFTTAQDQVPAQPSGSPLQTFGPFRNVSMVVANGPVAGVGGNIVLEASHDGINWFQLNLTAASTGATVTSNAATSTGVYVASSQIPAPYMRARLTAITSGSYLVSLAGA